MVAIRYGHAHAIAECVKSVKDGHSIGYPVYETADYHIEVRINDDNIHVWVDSSDGMRIYLDGVDTAMVIQGYLYIDGTNGGCRLTIQGVN